MQIALHDGMLLIQSPGDMYRQLSPFMAWNRRARRLEAPATMDNIERLGRLIRLTPRIKEEYERMREERDALNALRASRTAQVAFKLPVRVNLYEHQKKAVVMALTRFGVIGGDA